MQVIGAGFGRTGTESLKVALERLLDGKCYHMKEVIGNTRHLKMWDDFGQAGRTGMDWKALLADYEAGVDWPLCNYYKELMAVFPDAKVLLSVRDTGKWFDSYMLLVRFVDRIAKIGWLVPRFKRFTRMTDTAVWHIFDDRRDRANCIAVHERHIAEVKAHVPADRLLVFQVQEGWEPLCRFLGVDVPDEPFPHVNSREELQRTVSNRITGEVFKSVVTAALIAAAVIAGIYFLG